MTNENTLKIEDYTADMIAEMPVAICEQVTEGKVDMMQYRELKRRVLERANQLGIARAAENIFSVFEKARETERGGGYPDFVRVSSRGTTTVDCSAMAEYIRSEEHFLLEENPAQSGTNIYRYVDGVYRLTSEEELQNYVAGLIRDVDPALLRMKDVKEVTANLLTCCPRVNAGSLNALEDLVNFENGVLDLKTMKLTRHFPEYYSTVRIPCRWNGEATDCPVFRSFLNTVTAGDKKMQTLLCEYLGACLSGCSGYRFKKALFLFGEGNTGKTQYIRLAEMLLGKHNCADGISLAALENDRFATSQLYGRRLSGDADLSYLSVKELNTFKKLTGGDTIYAQQKGKPQFSFVYRGFLLYSMNRLPSFGGDRGAWVYDRILIAPFITVIPPDKRDPELVNKMYEEREAIVNICLRAFRKAIERGYRFTVPAVSEVLKTQYIIGNSPAKRFFAECCEMRPEGKTPDDKYTAAFLFDYFRDWCRDNNNGCVPKKSEFRKEIAELLKVKEEELILRTKKTVFYIFTLTGDEVRTYYEKRFLC